MDWRISYKGINQVITQPHQDFNQNKSETEVLVAMPDFGRYAPSHVLKKILDLDIKISVKKILNKKHKLILELGNSDVFGYPTN